MSNNMDSSKDGDKVGKGDQSNTATKQSVPLSSSTPKDYKHAKPGFLNRIVKKDSAIKQRREDLPKSNNEDTRDFLAMTSKELNELIERKVSDQNADLSVQLTSTLDSLRSHEYEIVQMKRENDYLHNRVELQQGRITRLEKVVEDQHEEILMMQARSMKDSVILYNVPEKGRETYEETKKVVHNFLKEEMKMTNETIKKVEINRAQRSGFNPRGPRNIIASMKTSDSKNVIFSHAKNLNRAKNFGISDQLP